MAQCMWMNISRNTLLFCPAPYPLLYGSCCQTGATAAGKYRFFIWLELLRPDFQPGFQRGYGFSPDRHHPGFRAFTGDPDNGFLQVERSHVQTDQFRQAQTGGVHQLQDGEVA